MSKSSKPVIFFIVCIVATLFFALVPYIINILFDQTMPVQYVSPTKIYENGDVMIYQYWRWAFNLVWSLTALAIGILGTVTYAVETWHFTRASKTRFIIHALVSLIFILLAVLFINFQLSFERELAIFVFSLFITPLLIQTILHLFVISPLNYKVIFH